MKSLVITAAVATVLALPAMAEDDVKPERPPHGKHHGDMTEADKAARHAEFEARHEKHKAKRAELGDKEHAHRKPPGDGKPEAPPGKKPEHDGRGPPPPPVDE